MMTAVARLSQYLETKNGQGPRKRAIGYIRVSTKGQAASKFSYKAQEAQIRAWAAKEGVEIVRFVYEQACARGNRNFGKRNKLKRLLDIAQHHSVSIVVATPCRLTRHAADYHEITSLLPGSQIMIADSNRTLDESYSDLVRAEKEGDEISYRTEKGMLKKKQAGQTFGSPDPEALQEAGRTANSAKRDKRVEWVTEVLKEIGPEATAREVAEELNRRGYSTAQGNGWDKVRVRRLLRAARERLNAQDAKSALSREGQDNPAEIYKDHPLFGRF